MSFEVGEGYEYIGIHYRPAYLGLMHILAIDRHFYIVIAPEFPPKLASAIPNYRPDPLQKALYMKRFTDNPGYNSMAAQTLDGKGYEDALIDLFQDPMPHFVFPTLNKQVVDQAWMMIDQLTRQVMSPQALMGMPGAPKPGQAMIADMPIK